MTYIFLGIVILITIMNLALVIRGRKNKRIAAQKYQELISGLRDRTIKVMKKRGLYFDRTYPLVADTDEGFLFCLDTKHRMASFTDQRKVRIMSCDDILSSTVEVQPAFDNPKFYVTVKLVIELAQDPREITIPFGNRKTSRTGIMGRFILDTATQMDTVLQEIIESNANQEPTDRAPEEIDTFYEEDTDEERIES